MASIREVFDKMAVDNILKKVLENRVINEDEKAIDKKRVFYKPFEYKRDDVSYVIKAEHVIIDDMFKYANSNCKTCNSKGYYVIHIEKSKLPNPVNYVLLSNVPFEGLSDKELEEWKEKVKLEKAWRVMLPCSCVLKKASNKDKSLFFNGDGSIIFRSVCEESK